MHAASLMKVPVMIEVFRRIDRGELKLDDPILVRNSFLSLADGSPYSLQLEFFELFIFLLPDQLQTKARRRCREVC